MKMLLATGIYPPDAGGPATYTRTFAGALVAAGHEVVVVAYGDQSSVQKEGGFVVRKVGRNLPLLVRYAVFAWNVWRQARGRDVVYLQGPGSEGIPGTVGARLAGVPTVMKVVGDYAWEMAAGSGETELLDTFLTHSHKGKVRMMEVLERWSARCARMVITPSCYLQSVVQKWGVSAERTQVIPNAVDALPEGRTREEARAAFGVTPEQRVLLTAVRAVPWKAGDFLIELLSALPSDIVLVIAGDGPERARWERVAVEQGVAERVRFVGRVDRATLADWYRAADRFALPSGYEGWPWVVSEAVSVGLPSVVSDKGGNPEAQEAFGEALVTVLPYRDRAAWKAILAAPWPPRGSNPTRSTFTETDMVQKTLHTLSAQVDSAVLRVVFLSYERGLTQPLSDAFVRVARFGSSKIALTAVVLPATEVREVSQGYLRAVGVSGSAPVRLLRAFWTTIREVRRARGQGERVLLSAQDPFLTGAIAFVVSRLLNVPFEIQEHADAFSGVWVHEAPVVHRVWTWIGGAVLRRADGVRVVSERIRDTVVRMGVAADRVQVLPVAQEIVETLAMRQPRSFPDVPTIVVPCRFVKQKRLDVLVEALALVARRGVAFRVRLMGEGPEGPRIAAHADRLGIRDRFSFEQWSDPLHLWDEADLFVLSSAYEGWGRTIVEAMAAGVPVVTTDVGCVGSFFRPGVDGLVVPVGDAKALAEAIHVQITQPEARQAMVQNARKRMADLPTITSLIVDQRAAWQAAVQRPASRRAWQMTAVIVLFAACIRLASFVWFGDTLGAHREWGFFTMVEQWFQGNGYAAADGTLSAYRSPGYLFFLTAVYGLFGFANFTAQAAIQNILAVVLVYLVYRLGWRLADDRRVGWIAAVIAAVHPYTFYHFTQYYHTVLSSVLLAALMLALLALDRTRRLRWAIGAGVFTAALAYMQGTILVAMPFVAAWIVWRWRAEWRRGVLAVGSIAIVSAGLIAPWTLRNVRVFHAFVPLTTDLGLAFYKANTENYERLLVAGYPHEALQEEVHPTDSSLIRYTYLPEVQAMLQATGGVTPAAFWTEWHPREPGEEQRLTEPQVHAHWMGLAWEWMSAHPGDAARLALRKAVAFWQPALYPSVRYGAAWSFGNEGALATLARVGLIGYVAVMELFAIAGVLVLARRKQWGRMAPFLIVFAVYTAMHMLFAPYTKYRIPLDALVAVFAAVGVWGVIHRFYDDTH